jgi:hypothetical protein
MSQTAEMRAPRKARGIINNLLGTRQITSEGLNWLIQATDPFHDTALEPTGYPDEDSAHSIVQCFTHTCNVSSGALAATYDVHIWFNPVTCTLEPLQEQKQCVIDRNGVPVSSANVMGIVGGYNIIGVPTGTDWQQLGALPANSFNKWDCRYPLTASQAQYRLVACGVEVVNTTPELYKGGALTCYRSPNSKGRLALYDSHWTSAAVLTLDTCTLPPSLQSDAQLYPTSRTWAAAEGCYLVGTLDSTKNDYLHSLPNYVATLRASGSTSNKAYVDPSVLGLTPLPYAKMQVLPYDTHGVIFVGLSKESTLQVTTKYYVERIPTIDQPDLLVLTRPPTPYDPVVLEIYTRTMASMPVGVMVKDNPLGEWFNSVCDFISDNAPAVGKALGNVVPGAGFIGNALGSAAKVAGAANRAAQRKAPNQQGKVMGQQPTTARKRNRKKKKNQQNKKANS